MARRLVWAALLLFGFYVSASAHDPGMTVATVIVEENQTIIEISVKGNDLEKVVGVDLLNSKGEVDDELLKQAAKAIGNHLRSTTFIETGSASCPLEVVELAAVEDGVLSVLKAPCGSANVGLSYSSRLLHQANPSTIQHVVLLKDDDATPVALTVARNTLEIQAAVPLLEVATRYLISGAEHIFAGYDHIAFLLALLLWARSIWPVVKVVTAFTLAHSITLSLAALGWVSVSSSIIEPLIAASVIAVAVENFFNQRIESRWKVAFLLGLIHGFGFASVLRDLGLPQDALLIALAFFNVGVEIGQVTIVVVLVMLLVFVDRLTVGEQPTPTRRPALVYTGSALIAALGSYWLIERTLLA